jgi:hypothetical protein
MQVRVRSEAEATRKATANKRAATKTIVSGEEMAGLAADERRAEGKSLREVAAREAHAGRKAQSDRRNPIELLNESNAGRIPPLIPVRYGE